ncbi:MAG: tetratricopeptide repeat protein [candidate division Zixibacteria bacterium]|nr:tetratricopeptide repeat protein [candidate division Zixibacteria bacterium]
MGTKVKLTKQQMKEDKFTTFMLQSKDWILENWQMISIAVAAVIVVSVGAIYYSNMKSGQAGEAADRFAEAIGKYRQQNYQVAILDFNGIADDYSGPIAASAVFYAANSYFESKNYDEAIIHFQKYIDKYHVDEIATASAYAGIAACREVKQEFQAAAEKYLEAIRLFPGLAGEPDYLLGAVRNYVNAGMADDVQPLLDKMDKDYAGTNQQRTATQLAMKLKIE